MLPLEFMDSWALYTCSTIHVVMLAAVCRHHARCLHAPRGETSWRAFVGQRGGKIIVVSRITDTGSKEYPFLDSARGAKEAGRRLPGSTSPSSLIKIGGAHV